MAETALYDELRSVQFSSFNSIFDKFKQLSDRYGNMPSENLISAFTRTMGTSFEANNPYIQNRRVKAIATLPENYTKDQVAEMVASPTENEMPLRQVEHILEYTAYPLFHIRKTYQELMTYHNYVSPAYLRESDAKRDDFWREWSLLEKFRDEMKPGRWAHQIAGQVLQEGKVFYYPRFKVDKAHNAINYAFMQQLPSDWVKIVGFNNKSKYTLSFNLFYFLEPGTDVRQFGDLFLPYMQPFNDVLDRGDARDFVYAQKTGVDLVKFRKMQEEGRLYGDPDAYYQNGAWYYWVTLPIDKVFTFEADDTNRNVLSPFAGLFVNMIQLAQYEAVQLEIVQNPLTVLFTGEIPYRDDKDATTADPYKLSNAGRMLFQALWNQMLAATNTGGIGLYMAPLENMKMHQLAEAPSATEISTNGYGYTMAKAGLSAIIPVNDEPRAGLAQISLQIEAKFAQTVYSGFEQMMKVLFERMRLKYCWKFVMFGDIATDKQTEDAARQGMTLGLLPETIIYNALHDRSLLDDMALSTAINASGILDKRIPLVTSYSAKQSESGLPPQAKQVLNPGGRPSAEGQPGTEGQEADVDTYGG